MAQNRLTMRQIKEILRHKFQLGLSNRKISKIFKISKTTVSNYLSLAKSAGIGWPIDSDLSDSGIYEKLFTFKQPHIPQSLKQVPECEHLHLELKKKGVTLWLLWEEYKDINPEGYSYTQFRHYYNQYKSSLKLSMKQNHKAGEKMFVDYSGTGIDIVDAKTGEIKTAELFVAVLGASNYTYVEATMTQRLQDWIGSHVRAFEYFGGVPQLIIPDNLKSGVTKPCRYEPNVNNTYSDMAEHYCCAVVPARPYKPKDKSKAEVAVQIVQRWILAKLRDRIFYSLHEANEAIKKLLNDLNHRPMQKIKKSRSEIFNEIEKSELKPLPQHPYHLAQFKKVKVNIDYHIEVDAHYYSVPHIYSLKEAIVRYTDHTIEIMHNGKRIASHRRSYYKNKFTTINDHMPKSHQAHKEWSPSRLIRWGNSLDKSVGELFENILETLPHPEQGYRRCLGIMRLEKTYGKDRLVLACKRALHLRSYSYQAVKRTLKNKLEETNMPQMKISLTSVQHENLRGRSYYEKETLQ
ncbi:MAG: IS21 family transposase [bacterium]|nr:IS21 family transposase [bacterium]